MSIIAPSGLRLQMRQPLDDCCHVHVVMVVGIVNLHLTVQDRVALRFVVHAELVEEFEFGAALWHTVGTHGFEFIRA